MLVGVDGRRWRWNPPPVSLVVAAAVEGRMNLARRLNVCAGKRLTGGYCVRQGHAKARTDAFAISKDTLLEQGCTEGGSGTAVPSPC